MGNTYTNKVGSSFFEEISQKNWGELQGNPQTEQEYIADFYGTDPSEKVNVDALVRFIKNSQNLNTNSFNWDNYNEGEEVVLKFPIPKIPGQQANSIQEYLKPAEIKFLQNVSWKYTDKNGKTEASTFNVKLNKRKNDFIDAKNTGVQIKFNESGKDHHYILDFYFQNTQDNRTYNPNNDFVIADKYIAMQFTTNKLKDFFYLWKNLFGNTTRLAEILSTFILKIQNDESLSLFYSNLSEEVIEVLQQLNIDKETLLNHLLRLKKYDEDSIFKDSSLAIINLLSIVKDSKYIYDWFFQHEDILLQLYYNLDGSTTFLEQSVSNKMLFAQMFVGICRTNNFEGYKGIDTKTFTINDKHKVLSKPFESAENNTFFLQQMQQLTTTVPDIETDELGVQIRTGLQKPQTYMQEVDNGSDFWPLQPVILEFVENGESMSLTVPALFVKALADEQVKNDIYSAIRVGFVVVALIAGVFTLGTASGTLAITLAAIDVFLTTADLVVTGLYREELSKTENGQKFLKIYDGIMLTASVVIIPFALAELFNLGLVLLRTTSQGTKQFIRDGMLKVLLEKNIVNFEGNTLKFITTTEEVTKATKAVLDEQKLTRLHKNNCFLVSGNVTINKKTVEEFALIYKGEVIAQGTKADFYEQIKEIGRNIHHEKRLVQTLDDLLIFKNRTTPSKLKSIFARPRGLITKITKKLDDSTRISLELENEAAEILAKNGFDIEQNPNVVGTLKNPDYKIEGKIFDCYTPSKDKPVRGLWTEVAQKIEKGQTKRIVLQLKIWEGDLIKLQQQFLDWPIEGLEEVMYITKDKKINYLTIK